MTARTTQARLGGLDNEPDFCTVGYERLPLAELFALLKAAGVRCLVDVREAPWSQVPEYRKASLEDRLPLLSAWAGYEVRYLSMPAVGNPPENRVSDKSLAEMQEFYRRHIQSKQAELERLYGLISADRTVLMCYEADPKECHRLVLAAVLAEKYRLTYRDLRQYAGVLYW